MSLIVNNDNKHNRSKSGDLQVEPTNCSCLQGNTTPMGRSHENRIPNASGRVANFYQLHTCTHENPPPRQRHNQPHFPCCFFPFMFLMLWSHRYRQLHSKVFHPSPSNGCFLLFPLGINHQRVKNNLKKTGWNLTRISVSGIDGWTAIQKW